eukprot:GHVS01085990.1.p1 GENE.GHVS01085990.1~~GHVS01085990.1.p1  ORF type:complete len:246 (+),score=46.93 GHVS01085990.1:148-885(+)
MTNSANFVVQRNSQRKTSSLTTAFSVQEDVVGVDVDVLMQLVKLYNKCASAQKPVAVSSLLSSKDAQIIARRPSRSNEAMAEGIEGVRVKAGERRYQRAIRGCLPKAKTRDDYMADYQASVSMGINALLGLFLTFLAGYWGVKYCYKYVRLQHQLVAGLIFSLICLVVEVCLFILYDHRSGTKRDKKKSQQQQPQQSQQPQQPQQQQPQQPQQPQRSSEVAEELFPSKEQMDEQKDVPRQRKKRK